MWNSHLFILFINPKANIWKKEGGKRNQYFLRRESGSERFKLLNFLHSGAFWHFFQKTTSLWTGFRLCTSVFKIISNSHRGHQTQLLTLETECWNDVLHNKGYLAHTQLIAHKRIVTYLYTKYCSHILYLVILIGNKYLCIKPLFSFLSMNYWVRGQISYGAVLCSCKVRFTQEPKVCA